MTTRGPWRMAAAVAAAAAVAVLYEAWAVFGFGGERLTVAIDDVGLAAVVGVAAALTGLRARRMADGGTRWGWLLLSASCAAWSAGQVVYSFYEVVLGNPSPFPSLADVGYLPATNVYRGPNLIDVGWIVGYLLVGLGGLVGARQRPLDGNSRPSRWQVLLPYAPLVLVSLMVGVDELRQQVPDSFSQCVIAALIGLVLARQLIEMIQSQALAARLQSALRASAEASAERASLIEHAPVG